MHRQMSFVDCSCITHQSCPSSQSFGPAGLRSYVVALLGLP